jgi:hypothetical protein
VENDVYVAGSTNDGIISKACYWKNGTRTDLPSASYAVAFAIVVAGNDIYVAGAYVSGSATKACYWKNGTKTDLHPSGALSSDAGAIAVAGSDVYVAVNYKVEDSDDDNEDKWKACYWKNGTKTDITVEGKAQANDITVAGSDVYVTGCYFNSGPKACYWKNSTKTDLGSSSDFAEAYAIAVVDPEVYTAGRYIGDGDESGACYWKGTTKTDLSDAESIALGIAVVGDDVYTAGFTFTGNFSDYSTKACYWKNSVKKDLL